MEKNGAISSSTPGCGKSSCGCKKAADEDTVVFPTDKSQADAMDKDLTRNLADTVKTASVKK